MPAILAVLEVVDKVPTLTRTWLTFLAVGAVGRLIARLWRRSLWGSVPVFLFFAWATVAQFTDPFVGPAIRAEAGMRYLLISLGATVIGAVLLGTGALPRYKARSGIQPASGPNW